MMTRMSVAVIGGGNGARAFAGHLSLKGAQVRLLSSFPQELEAIKRSGTINVTGVVEGKGKVEVCNDNFEAISDARLILVVVPAFAHAPIARAVAPYLKDDHIVVLNPGRTGGALEFSHVIKSANCEAKVHVAETQTLLYACRIEGPAGVRINGIKKEVAVAAFPADNTTIVLSELNKYFPQFKPVPSVLYTSLMNIGAVFHPTTVLLNAGRIESGETFEFYRDGMTPAVTTVLEKVDEERCAIARALDVPISSALEWLQSAYGVNETTLRSALINNPAYQGIKAPTSLKVRYLLEDVPTGLIPLTSLGELAGINTPTCRAVVDLACAALSHNFWNEGRTLEKLGLKGMSKKELHEYLQHGVSCRGK